MENFAPDFMPWLISIGWFIAAMFVKDWMYLRDRKHLLSMIEGMLKVNADLLAEIHKEKK